MNEKKKKNYFCIKNSKKKGSKKIDENNFEGAEKKLNFVLKVKVEDDVERVEMLSFVISH